MEAELDIVGDTEDGEPPLAPAVAGPRPHRFVAVIARGEPGSLAAIGLALLQGSLCPKDKEFAPPAQHMRKTDVKAMHGKSLYGFVVYTIVQFHAMAAAMDIGDFDTAGWSDVKEERTASDGRALYIVAAEMVPRSAALPVFVEVCPLRAALVVEGRADVLHLVAVGQRMNKRLLLSSWPSSKVLNRFRRMQVYARVAPAANVCDDHRRRGTNPWKGIYADQFLKWIRATSYIKSLAECTPATEAFLHLLLPSGAAKLEQHFAIGEIARREVLRAGRVRIDCMAMLVSRCFFEQAQRPWYFLWTDASPQWKGREYSASSYDEYDAGNDTIVRRLLPCISLTKGKTSTLDKTVALLHQIWLTVGAQNLQSFCRSVRSICTDMGVERGISTMNIDVLRSFLLHIGAPVFVQMDSPWVFPSALLVPGWRHSIDLLLRRGLWTFPFFAVHQKGEGCSELSQR